ncbi:MAG: pyrroline-5-carboxylate reductase [Planctomycetota bacterium]
MSDFRYKLGFIGSGNMAEAIARGAIEQGVLKPEQMMASDPTPTRRDAFEAFGVNCVDDSAGVIAKAEQIVLAVKPQILPKLGEALGGLDLEKQVVVSIMAGIASDKIESALGGPARVVRVMPNTPLMVGHGMSAVALGPHAKPGDDALILEVLGACGEAIRVDESQMDAVTAVSGSGPAYLFLLAEAMRQAAEGLGVGEHADVLVNQTLLGASTLLKTSPDGPAELRAKVTSPGGTTQAAIECFQKLGFEPLVRDAMTAARDRSVDLGKT